MGRILRDIQVEGEKKKAIFDTGSVQSFIVKKALPECAVCIKINPIDMRLAGSHHKITKRCFVEGKLENTKFEFDALVIDNLGRVQEKGDVELDILIGATTMEEWAMNVNPRKQTIDLGGLKKRQFLAF